MSSPAAQLSSQMNEVRESMFNTVLKALGFRKPPVIHSNPDAIRIAAFISIPKNASKSVLEILRLGPNRDVEDTTSLVIYENHQRAQVLKRRFELDDLFLFCFARNPYDRCVSWYEYHKDIEPYCHMSFESWIRQGMPHHVQVQNGTDYLANKLTPLLQFTYLDSLKMDYIGRMESFEQDMAAIIDKLNAICTRKELLHRFRYTPVRINTSRRNDDFQCYYTQETREIVYAALSKDFEYFGYDK